MERQMGKLQTLSNMYSIKNWNNGLNLDTHSTWTHPTSIVYVKRFQTSLRNDIEMV